MYDTYEVERGVEESSVHTQTGLHRALTYLTMLREVCPYDCENTTYGIPRIIYVVNNESESVVRLF